MSKDDKIRMPMSGGGLVTYHGDVKSKFMLKPAHIIIMVVAVLFVWLMLRSFGNSLFALS
jgi:hypothetical protein